MRDLIGDFVVTTAHETFNGHNGVHGIGNGLAFRRITYLSFSILQETDDRRGRTTSFIVGDHYGLISLHDSYAAVRRAEVNSYNFSHIVYLILKVLQVFPNTIVNHYATACLTANLAEIRYFLITQVSDWHPERRNPPPQQPPA